MKVTILSFSIACFASFTWAIIYLFKRTNVFFDSSIRWLSLFGWLFSIWQWTEIVVNDKSDRAFAIGLLFYAVSFTLFWCSVFIARQASLMIAFDNNTPDVLIVDGPFRYIRHPFYTSYMAYWIAGVFASQSLWLLSSIATMGGFYVIAINKEENAFMNSPMAQKYAFYKTHTGAVFPKIRWVKAKTKEV